jgi:hypothetical protein
MDAEDQPIAARTDGANLLTELIAGRQVGANGGLTAILLT